MQTSVHPSKEQVRAYMHLRECDRRPPPPPDEIRRRVGWQSNSSCPDFLSASTLLFPGTIAQLSALLLVEWCFLAAGVRRPN